MSLIALEGLEIFAYHGYYSEEQKIGGKYVVDIYAEGNFSGGIYNDELKGTVNYEVLYEIVKREMNIPSKLIEHVAQRIANAITSEWKEVESIKVRVSKLHPPLPGATHRAYIELTR